MMVARTPSVGSMKENMFAPVMYLACYGFAYYKADSENITMGGKFMKKCEAAWMALSGSALLTGRK